MRMKLFALLLSLSLIITGCTKAQEDPVTNANTAKQATTFLNFIEFLHKQHVFSKNITLNKKKCDVIQIVKYVLKIKDYR